MQVAATVREHKHLATAIVGAALLLLLLWLVDWKSLISVLRGVAWEQVLLAVPFLLFSFLLLVTGWQHLLPEKVAWRETFLVTSVSFAVSILTPLPDSALRIITTEEGTGVSLTEVTVALAMERLLALIMRFLALIAFLSVWTWHGEDSTLFDVTRIILIVGAVAFVLWIVRHPESAAAQVSRLRGLPYLGNMKVEERVAKLAASVNKTFTLRRFLRMFGLFLLISLSSGIFHLLILAALPIRLSPQTMAAVALVLFAGLPPIVPMMIGVYQTVAIALLVALLLLDAEQATAYAVLVQVPQIILWALLGALSYRRSNLSLSTLTAKARALLRDRGAPGATAL
jgi:uncharacterized membrane protein YbhN (UPF0104 family)